MITKKIGSIIAKAANIEAIYGFRMSCGRLLFVGWGEDCESTGFRCFETPFEVSLQDLQNKPFVAAILYSDGWDATPSYMVETEDEFLSYFTSPTLIKETISAFTIERLPNLEDGDYIFIAVPE